MGEHLPLSSGELKHMANGDRQGATSSKSQNIVIERVTPDKLHEYAPRLGAIISAHTAAGHSTYFTYPFTVEQTIKLFTANEEAMRLAPGPGGVVMWVARLPAGETPLQSLDKDGLETTHSDIIGTVQLSYATMPNGLFRTEVKKLLVDERYFRRGVGRKLMQVLEDEARATGSTLCLLDTEEEYHGLQFYLSLGWKIVGKIPNFFWPPDKSEKRTTVVMYKDLV